MSPLPIIYLAYMFVSIYLLVLTLLLYFRNKDRIWESPKMTKHYSISVLIPAYNEEETIANTVKSIYEMDYDNIKEVIVINDESKDNTLKIVQKLQQKYSNLKVINKKNSGKSDSVNQAIKVATGELIVIIDADSYPDKNSFKLLVGHFDDPEVGVATGACIPQNRNTFLEKLQVLEYKVIAFTRKLLGFIDSIYVAPGTLAMYRRKALVELGGFDPKNITEDIEMTWHFLDKGWKVRQSLNAFVGTTTPNTFGLWYKQRRRWALGGLQCVAKYKSRLFRNNMFGYFVVPFFTIGLFLGLIGVLIFLYLVARRAISSYLITRYSIASDVPLVTLNEIYITPTVLNYFGLVLFFLFLAFNLYVLAIMKDNIKEKQSFFNLFFYMTVYMMIYPIVLVTSIWHYYRGKMIWR